MRLALAILVSYLVCHVRSDKVLDFWHPQNLVNDLGDRTRALKELIHSKGLIMRQYLDNAQNRGKVMSTQVVDFINNKADMLKHMATRYDIVNEPVDHDTTPALPPITLTTTTTQPDTILRESRDPDVYLTTPQIIVRHGYRAESHTVKTDDGYLLTLHRIPYGKKHSNQSGRPVLLHHGLLGSSADWILAGPSSSLAYMLADEGYDVWMANARGNTYSRAHVSLLPSDSKFWNYTWHEIGYYDVPACIDYINEFRGVQKDLMYIGHSMGTTILFVALSSRPEYNDKMHSAYALAPVAYMSAIRSPVRLLAPIAKNIDLIATMFGANEFLPQNTIIRWLSEYGCEKLNVEESICENVMFVICGYDKAEFNKALLPIILGHTPAGVSTKTLVHYAQEINADGRFQHFDYGDSINMQLYHSKEPPEYPLDKVTLPIALFSAKNDWLSGEADAEKLFKRLQNGIVHRVIPMPSFNHLDFLIGLDAPKLVYQKLISLMKKTEGVRLVFSINANDFKVIWQ